jgi:hypothetical protein
VSAPYKERDVAGRRESQVLKTKESRTDPSADGDTVSFDGEVLPLDKLLEGPGSDAWESLDLPSFSQRHSRAVREPEILACAATLRSELGFKKVGTVGYW